MSNHDDRPAQPTDRPTATYPTHPLATAYPLPEGWRVDPAGYLPGPLADPTDRGAAAARLAQADATPTVTFPVHPLGRQPQAFTAVEPEAEHEGSARTALWPGVTEQADAAFIARTGARVPVRVPVRARARVYHTPARRGPAAGRSSARTERRQARRERVRRHLRAALTAIALAAALLSVLQAYAAQGISQARQAALAARTEGATSATATSATAAPVAPSSTMSGQTPTPATMSDRTSTTPMSGQMDTQSDWVTEDTGAPYVRTNPHASPLTELPRCTTAPDTPMPCLAHVSANSDRAVILEEDGSLTALVPSHTR